MSSLQLNNFVELLDTNGAVVALSRDLVIPYALHIGRLLNSQRVSIASQSSYNHMERYHIGNVQSKYPCSVSNHSSVDSQVSVSPYEYTEAVYDIVLESSKSDYASKCLYAETSTLMAAINTTLKLLPFFVSSSIGSNNTGVAFNSHFVIRLNDLRILSAILELSEYTPVVATRIQANTPGSAADYKLHKMKIEEDNIATKRAIMRCFSLAAYGGTYSSAVSLLESLNLPVKVSKSLLSFMQLWQRYQVQSVTDVSGASNNSSSSTSLNNTLDLLQALETAFFNFESMVQLRKFLAAQSVSKRVEVDTTASKPGKRKLNSTDLTSSDGSKSFSKRETVSTNIQSL